MNPARTFGPDLASGTFTSYRIYIAGAAGAQGDLFTETQETGKSEEDGHVRELLRERHPGGALGANPGSPVVASPRRSPAMALPRRPRYVGLRSTCLPMRWARSCGEFPLAGCRELICHVRG
jgi:hypothetical protein